MSIAKSVGIALLGAFTGIAAAAAPPEATTYQITPDHAGVTNSGGVLALQPKPLWTRTLTGTASYPVIAGGRVFVTAPAASGPGSLISAFDAKTGNPVWGPVAIGGTYPWSAATYDAGKLFVLNVDGLLSSFDAATGAAGWSAQMPGQYLFSAPPNATGGKVYTGGAGSGGTVYAVDESNGAVLWTAGVMNGDESSPAISGGNLYVSYPCQVYDFDPATGASLWHYNGPCEGGGGRTVAAAGGRVYSRDWAASNYIFDGATGAILDTFTSTPIPAVTSTTAFYLSGSTLSAVDIATDAIKWTFAGDSQLISPPIVIDQSVIEASATGQLYALDVATGRLQWQASAGANVVAPEDQTVGHGPTGMAAADGVLVVAAGNTVVAFAILGPPAPTGLAATGVPGAVHLAWMAAAGAATYDVYSAGSAGTEGLTPLKSGVTGTSTDITGLTIGANTFFTVKAVSAAGVSAPSNEASAAALPVPAPSGLTATAGVGSVTLSWSAVQSASGYSIYAGTTAGGEGAQPVITNVSATNVVVSNLAAGVTRYFVVRATANGVLGAASNEVSATPTSPPPPVDAGGGGGSGGGGSLDFWSLLAIAVGLMVTRRPLLRRADGVSTGG